MKKNRMLLAALAALLILTASVGSALAYFTCYTLKSGERPITVRPTTTITEEFDSWTKRVSISNTGAPCFVRLIAYAGEGITLTSTDADWQQEADGYWYYRKILGTNDVTSVWNGHITGIPDAPRDGDTFNVAINYEYTPVLYREDGTPYADWTKPLTIVE